MQKVRYLVLLLVICLATGAAAVADSSQPANAARVVAWQPKPGMVREFELGYRRHLDWHRAHEDSWTWHGWSIVSGPRTGYFVDGTFFHRWADFDSPVAPEQDAADNAINVVPYATLQGVAAYEAVPELSGLDEAQLGAPLLTFTYIEVAPGRGAEFESLIAARERAEAERPQSLALLRPVAGTHEYLLLMPAQSQAGLAVHARVTERLLARIARRSGASIVKGVRTETGRYRADLSYVPGAH